jgi:hypothetical protein
LKSARAGTRVSKNDEGAGGDTTGDAAHSNSTDARRYSTVSTVYHRGHDGDESPEAIAVCRRAYDAAIAEGADPRDIVAGAKRAVAAQTDGPRYLTELGKWLRAKRWTRPEVEGTPAPRHRDGVRRNGKMSGAEAMALAGRQAVEAEGRTWGEPQ